MTDLHDAAENVAALERAYAAIPKPIAPELGPVPERRETVEAMAAAMAPVVFLAGCIC